MKQSTCDTHWAKIYIAGPIDQIEQICRKWVLRGACVTVTPTNYIYSGGEETGAEIGFINYPRFPKTNEELTNDAINLGQEIMEGCHQVSYTVTTPDKSYYFSRREELGLR